MTNALHFAAETFQLKTWCELRTNRAAAAPSSHLTSSLRLSRHYPPHLYLLVRPAKVQGKLVSWLLLLPVPHALQCLL